MKKNLIYIHGIFDTKYSNPSLYNLCKDLNINFYSLDLPGHGDEEFNNINLDVESYGNYVKDYIIKNNINKNLIIYGHSMGGGIATYISSTYKKELNIEQLILEDPLNSSIYNYLKIGLKKPRSFFSKIDKMDKYYSKNKSGYIKKWFKWFDFSIPRRKRIKLFILATNIISKKQFDRLDEYYKNLNVPVNIIFGEYDRFIPPEISKLKILSLNNNINFHLVKNSGHAPHTENAKEYVGLMAKILIDENK